MADTVVHFKINLRSSAQGRYRGSQAQGEIKAINDGLFNSVTYAIHDIAFKAAKNQQRNVSNQLETKFASIANQELRNMGRKIATLALGIGPANRWPQGGSLEVEGGISRTLARTDITRTQPMVIKAVTGQWRARTEEYLKWKSKKFGHKKWFMNSGDLRSALQNPQLYLSAYGPIRVAWTPERVETTYKPGGADVYSKLARGIGRSYTLTVGHIHMTLLGRITREMLNDPGQPSYDSRFNGLLNSLPSDVEKKLANRGDPYRPIIEPFLTFYLNRQIPNRIWRELEKSIKRVEVR